MKNTWKIICWLCIFAIFISATGTASAQDSTNADVAIYQLGVVAEARPGSEINYLFTVTNRGPKTVSTFYILDGWTVNQSGIAGFTSPVADPAFDKFKLAGKWQQTSPDQRIMAWLLNGELRPGDTVQFAWKIKVNADYRGALVNWAGILIEGQPKGKWEPMQTEATPPPLNNAPDPTQADNRTADGVTLVTDSPGGKGIDLAVFQTGLLSTIPTNQPLNSTLLVTNRGPEAATQFYLMAAWSLNTDGSSLLVTPVPDPNFGTFRVRGRWQQKRVDEEVWLWLLEGDLKAGSSAQFEWKRTVEPAYRGDIVNWARVVTTGIPDGQWTPREGTNAAPASISNPQELAPDNNRTEDMVTTISD